MPETATDLVRAPRAPRLAPGTCPKYSDAERVRRKLAMREKRAAIKKDASGFGSLATICAAVGLPMSAPSALNPILFHGFVSLAEGLDLRETHVPLDEYYRGNRHMFSGAAHDERESAWRAVTEKRAALAKAA